MTAADNGGDQGLGKDLAPYPMLGEELLEVFLLFGTRHGLEFVDGLLHGGFGVAEGREKARVGGGLIAAQASLFVDDELFDQGCEGDPLVGVLNEADRGVGAADLPDEDTGQQEAGDNWEKKNLPQRSFEPFKLQDFSSFILFRAGFS